MVASLHNCYKSNGSLLNGLVLCLLSPPPILIFQVFAEYNRIASMNLEAHFSEALVQHTPRFIELFKSKKGTVGHKLTELM